jgi:hypothetical protein
VSRSGWLNLSTAGSLATVRSCSAPSLITQTSSEDLNAGAVDLGTTLRVAPRVHSPNNNRPERNENCVTHVVGLNCYLCRRLLSEAPDEWFYPRAQMLRRMCGDNPPPVSALSRRATLSHKGRGRRNRTPLRLKTS